jgi:ribose 5-phosphate isomerase B
MTMPEGAKPSVYESIFILEKNGEKKEFTLDNYPDSTWTFVDTRTILKEKGYEVVNYGTDSNESCDYPVYGEKVGEAVAHGDVDLGILICGTGVGISLAANKVEGIRAVVCSEPYTAKLSRQHNNTNILAFGARVIGIETAKMIVDEWLNAEFMGGKHERRVNMLMDIEKRKIHGDK